MANLMRTAELRKAANNLKRSEEYLSARGRWTLDHTGLEVMRALHETVEDMSGTVEAILLYHDISVTSDPRQPPEQAPPATFDLDRLQRLSAFFNQLHRWFLTHAKGEVEPGGEPLLGQIHGTLLAIQRSMAQLIKWGSEGDSDQPTASTAVEPAASAPAGQEPAVPGGKPKFVDRVYDGAGSKGEPVVPKPQLVIREDAADPWFRWVSPDDIALTPSAKDRIFQFLDDGGVEFLKYQKEKFAEEVRRRIESAPEGFILVIKIGSDNAKRKPYLGYEPADEVEA